MKLDKIQVSEPPPPQILLPNVEFKTRQAHAGTTVNSSIQNPNCTQKAKPGLFLSQCSTQCLQ